MNYLKYTGLFGVCFVIFFVIGFGIVGVCTQNSNINPIGIVFTLVPFIALFVASIIVSITIIVSNGRAMTFGEIIIYFLCFFMVVTIIPIVISISIKIMIIHTTIGKIIVLLILIPMFLVNIFFKIKYKNRSNNS
ncbi:MAG: hypothetical protein LBG67_03290 [Campylobacteraceae bacterium]|jgi:hypothetical protein|nr:hypothetical protein [Campylobacteraceae bacterium]